MTIIFDILIIDEAHHSRARTYENSINKLNPRYTLGLTATPFRRDRLSLNNLFGEALVYYNVSRGIRNGYLAEVEYRMKGNNLDTKWITESSDKGYTIKQLNKKLFIPTQMEVICEEFIKYWKKYDRKIKKRLFGPLKYSFYQSVYMVEQSLKSILYDKYVYLLFRKISELRRNLKKN